MTPGARVLEPITRLLAGMAAPGSFATRRVARADDLHLDVKGIGPVPLPLSATLARRLCDVARPARYGLRDRTLLDERVRDAWEIGRSQIKLDVRRWRRTLDPGLEQIARDLGLPAGRTLRAELHNLLVYGPGQFFSPHQDSEKADGMVGTLVVLLPSGAKGGALVIEHHDEEVSYRGASKRLVLVAFYADCHHEVRPVTEGYRAALTYNLFLEGAGDTSSPSARGPLDALVRRVREYFETPRLEGGPYQPSRGLPDRLVYLLDHQYTQKGLGWECLKNGDAARAALLREVAARLDCEIVLALADVHESWSCEDEGDHDGYGWRGRRGRGWRYDDPDDEDDEEDAAARGETAEDYRLVELCDSSIELRHWVAPSGKRVRAISGDVFDDEVCYTKATVELEPFASEHEGYTGNAGNTVDRWYHRAAVMLWPRARTYVIRAKASPAWAIRQIARSLAAGELDAAREMATQLRPFWSTVASREPDRGFVEPTLRVGAALDEPGLATALLDPLALEDLTPRMGSLCIALLERYGLPWCWAVFERWASRSAQLHGPRATWLAALPDLCGPWCAGRAADPVELTRRLVRSQWAWVDNGIRVFHRELPSTHAARGLLELSGPIVGLLATAASAHDRELQQVIAGRLTSAQHYPVRCALRVLRAAHARCAAAVLPALGLGALHDDCTRTLTRLVSEPVRDPDDWSITTPLRCTCELCQQLARFLRSGDQRRLEWPLASERRAHVHEAVRRHELPVTHQTRRTGRPYVLVLTKTRALFTGAATERKSSAKDLAWLRKTARAFVASRA